VFTVAEKNELAKTKSERKAFVATLTSVGMDLRNRLIEMSAPRRRWMIISLLFVLAIFALTSWFVQRPDWQQLFSGLDAKDVQQVSQELAAGAIPFRVTPDGSNIEVPGDVIDKARMVVAAKGMPHTGRLGFELFDKPNWVGSDFDEHVNYQRALEGELEQTIGSLEIVQSARVHLVLPEPSLFTSEAKPAKASVVLKLRNTSIDPAQIESIRSLVAGAVDGLSPVDVSLIDADGRVDLKPRSKSPEEGEMEQAMEAKLVALLEPLAGRDNVRATVHVSFNHGTTERTEEVYDPTQSVALSMQRSEQTSNQGGKPSGVPGTASNTPAASPNGAVQGSPAATPGSPPLLPKDSLSVYPQSGGQVQTIKEESGTYANTKHLFHSEEGPGKIDRISTAIVVNDRIFTEGEGKEKHTVWKARSVDEMRRMEELVQAAAGYDPKRGDQVVVKNMSFVANSLAAPVGVGERTVEQLTSLLRSEPGLLRTLLLGVCGILLVMVVLRPMASQMMMALRESASEIAVRRTPYPLEPSVQQELRTLRDSNAGDALMPDGSSWKRGRTSAQVIFDEVTDHIRREPIQSTRILENWISTQEEPEAE
jgi:flagellar M-ring protein FliF